MQSKLQAELKRLLQQGEQMGEIEQSPEDWESQTRLLIDQYLGSKLEPPTNAHSEGYYEFSFARSHRAKLAVLRTILLFDPRHAVNPNNSDSKQPLEQSVPVPAKNNIPQTPSVIQIIVAIIGAIGVIAAAVISVWFKK